ncbi:MAG TPA: hypothetical protein PKC24_05085 [Cyclobacteriaceae bacterium]|nr:hypothetical protein [Cyclobacteriaceae bacterium]
MAGLKRFILSFLCLLLIHSGMAQSAYLSTNADYHHWIDRYEVKSGKVYPQVFSSIKPYRRQDVIKMMDSVRADGLIQSAADEFNLQFIRNDSWEWASKEENLSTKPVFKHFYRVKSDFYHVDQPELDLHINPVIYFGLGSDEFRQDPLYFNTRGIEVRGMIDRKVGFYTYLSENQARLPFYTEYFAEDDNRRNMVVPGEGLWKRFKGDGVDFLQARGYITFDPTQSINLQLGHDQFFTGNGYRSMIFSDFAPPAFFLKADVKVWKFQYRWMIRQHVADIISNRSGAINPNKDRYPENFFVYHHLSFNIGKRFNLGLFESVVFSPRDANSSKTFEFGYLNPIIFFRAVEHQNGSADNILLGADLKWNFAKGFSLYGQVVLDEFVLSNVMEGNGWGGNKFAYQAGVKHVDAFGIYNLDLQVESNIVRPYTYAYSRQYGSYTHYRQALAHPMGANFYELIGIMRYQPLPRLNLVAKSFFIRVGRDDATTNWGSNLMRLNAPRTNTFGNTIAQGVQNDIYMIDLKASYQLKHNLFFDAGFLMRDSRSDEAAFNNKTNISSIALRWNIAQRNYHF